MPARSEAQRRALNARFGHGWVKRHGYDNRGKLPERSKGRKRKGKKDRRQHLIDQFVNRHGQ